MRKSIAVFLAILAVSACASAPVQRSIDRSVVLPGVQFEKVWNATIDLFGERNWTIANMEKASGFINSDWMNAEGTNYLDCGSPGLNTDREQAGKFNFVVRQDGNNTIVAINTTWVAVRAFGNSPGTRITCVSTGNLEQEVRNELRRRVGVTQ